MTLKQSNNNKSKNLTLIRLYGLRSCEAFTYIWLKENLLLSIYFCIPITTFLFGQRSLVQKVSYTLIQNVVIPIIFLKNEVEKETFSERRCRGNGKFGHLKQDLTLRSSNHLWLSWNVVMKLRNDSLTSLSSRFILQAVSDQRGKYLPRHISGARGDEAGRQEQLISPPSLFFLSHIWATVRECVNFPGSVCRNPGSSATLVDVGEQLLPQP